MGSQPTNPYEPPLAANDTPSPATTAVLTAPIPFVLVLAAAVAFHAFILMLIQSNAGDRIAGLLFLFNTPVMFVWAMRTWRAKPNAHLVGFVSAGTQVGITLLMLALRIGDWRPVCVINGMIVAGIAAVAALSWLLASKTPSPP